MRIQALVTHAVVRAPDSSNLKNSFNEKDYDIELTAGRIFEGKTKNGQARGCIPCENVPYFIPAADQKTIRADKPS